MDVFNLFIVIAGIYGIMAAWDNRERIVKAVRFSAIWQIIKHIAKSGH